MCQQVVGGLLVSTNCESETLWKSLNDIEDLVGNTHIVVGDKSGETLNPIYLAIFSVFLLAL
jgi:hypothetical protein